jgi:DNA-directed RNA polymerase subunit M/transcription elongation factor TFIIS
MVIVGCPTCGWPLVLPDCRRGTYFCCLNCEHGFDTGTASVLSRKAAQNEREVRATPSPITNACLVSTQLTSPHQCHHCHESLPAIHQRRTDIHCPHCSRRTSVYAVLYHCPECGAVLESPLARQGETGRCPACREHLTIPSDVLFNDGREKPDHTWFVFPCPGCRWALHSRSADARKSAVCPHCLYPLVIPLAGETATG